MKKIISILIAVIMLFSVATLTTGAAQVDMADTGEYYISEKPFEEVAEVDGIKVIGYLGDLDGDKKITVLDATKIQLAIAKKTTLSDTQTLLADTDRDGGISVIDATDIQRYIAKLTSNSKVAHTLYTKTTATTDSVYDQIIKFIKSRVVYNTEYKWYLYTVNDDTSNVALIYYPEKDQLALSYDAGTFGTSFTSVYLTIPKSYDDYCSYMVTKYANNKLDYDVYGKAKQVNSTDTKLKLTNYEFMSETGKTYAKVESDVQKSITDALNAVQKTVGNKVSGNIYTLFASFDSFTEKYMIYKTEALHNEVSPFLLI